MNGKIPAAIDSASWETSHHQLSDFPGTEHEPAGVEMNALCVAALALCLRRYGAPESEYLMVHARDGSTTPADGITIPLSFSDALTSATWINLVRDTLTGRPPAQNIANPTVETDGTLRSWCTALVLGRETLAPGDNIHRSSTRVFATHRRPGAISFSASRLTQLSDPWPLDQMLRHWHQLASALHAAPDQPIGSLSVLTPEELRTLAGESGVPDAPIADPRFGFELFDDQVARTPDASAVSDGATTLTYRELAAQANRMAHHLRNLGVGPEVIVGVFLDRSIALVVTLLAVQKAGGACLPVDPAYPARRREYLVTDSRVRIVVTNTSLGAMLPGGTHLIVNIDRDRATIDAAGSGAVDHGLKPGNTSAIFYTSGSTGQPKGVLMTHAVRPRWDPARRKPDELAPGEKSLLKSAVGFTFILRETLWPLQTGGHLVIVPPGLDRDAAGMIALLRDENIAATHFVPSMLSLLVDEPGFAACTSVRLIFTAGESLKPGLQRRLLERLPGVRLFVFYGCTEAPSATQHECRLDDLRDERVIIGRPMPGKRVYLLDRNRVPVPHGVVGEIYSGGTISRGYLHRPDLTGERFIPDPFSQRADARMYQTGDLARWLPDERLEFVGRADFQIKIRGVRVEPGEIESAVRSHPGVTEVAVVTRADASGDQPLVAYFKTGPNEKLTPDTLRAHTARELPAHLVPAFFVPVAEWPLTANGKLDRTALPSPDSVAPARDIVPPRTETERCVAEIWAHVLGRERVSVHGNFFELGGHSLAALRVISRLRTELGIELPLRTLFESPTVALQAAALEKARTAASPTADQAGTEEIVI